MSLFLQKPTAKENQQWSFTWTPGAALANFFALYNFDSHADANGDFTTTGATSIATTLDGPIQVARFRGLTVNHALTPSQRCRGLMPIADTLAVGAAGAISMTGMGAAGSSKWAYNRDIFVPQSITFTGKNTSWAQFLAWIRQTGYCIFDPNMYANPLPGMGDVQCDWATWTPYGTTIIPVSGCGAHVMSPASVGIAGTSGGTGSGGCGGLNPISTTGAGRPWGGGGGSAGANGSGQASPDDWGGVGGTAYASGMAGGAGNPGGAGGGGGATAGTSGTGGILLVLARVSATLTGGHGFYANGSTGGNGSGQCGGGGSGGGSANLLCIATPTGTPNLTATGGAGGTGTSAGYAGGAGSTRSTTFAAMGW